MAQLLQPRYLRIGIIGPIGSGKSTLAKILGNKWGVAPISENFVDNPHLEKFYNDKDPKKHALASQLWFLKAKIALLKEYEGKSLEILDPALEMDFLYSETMFNMGLLNKKEIGFYRKTTHTLKKKAKIYDPDFFIVVNTSGTQLKKRVEKRGRDLERKLSAKYLKSMSLTVSSWVRDNKDKVMIIEIDSYRENFASPGKTRNAVVSRIEKAMETINQKEPKR